MKSGRIIKCDQGDSTWLHERVGRVTASRITDVVSKLKNGKPSAARETYKMELLTEVLTGQTAEHFVTAAMQHGIETEPLARSMYEIEKNVSVERIGMVIHPKIERASASPDGLVGDWGLVEFKCPQTATHLRYFIDGVVPEDYKAQMSWQLACTGRSWVDFCSYDSRLPADFGLFIKRFERDEEAICQMEKEVETFIAELNAMCEKLLKGRPAPTAENPAAPGPPKAILPDWQPVSDSK
jgi:putative phage-type endonuclease